MRNSQTIVNVSAVCQQESPGDYWTDLDDFHLERFFGGRCASLRITTTPAPRAPVGPRNCIGRSKHLQNTSSERFRALLISNSSSGICRDEIITRSRLLFNSFDMV